MRVAAVVLAAGEATRFGSPKQRLLLPRVLERVGHGSGHRDHHRLGRVRARTKWLSATRYSVSRRAVHDWSRGPGASLRCGLRCAPEDSIEAAVVVLADGPGLSPAAVDRVLAAWREGRRDRGGVVRRRARASGRSRSSRLELRSRRRAERRFPSGSSPATTSDRPATSILRRIWRCCEGEASLAPTRSRRAREALRA